MRAVDVTDAVLVVGAVAAVASLAAVTLFQVALAAGAPWGRAAYGGQESRLPTRLRIASAIAAVVWLLVTLAVLRRAGLPTWAPLHDAVLPVALWGVVALLALGVILNAITRSRIERAIWLPTTIVALAGTTTVALLGSGGV